MQASRLPSAFASSLTEFFSYSLLRHISLCFFDLLYVVSVTHVPLPFNSNACLLYSFVILHRFPFIVLTLTYSMTSNTSSPKNSRIGCYLVVSPFLLSASYLSSKELDCTNTQNPVTKASHVFKASSHVSISVSAHSFDLCVIPSDSSLARRLSFSLLSSSPRSSCSAAYPLRSSRLSAGENHGWSSKHPGHCTTDTVRTAFPHFRQRYGPSPSAALCAIALGCEKARVVSGFYSIGWEAVIR